MKFISLGANIPGDKDSWDIVKKHDVPDSAFPLGAILTLLTT
jgi:alcohol dehydrogenase YqhD (iron-dependent ADH family)